MRVIFFVSCMLVGLPTASAFSVKCDELRIPPSNLMSRRVDGVGASSSRVDQIQRMNNGSDLVGDLQQFGGLIRLWDASIVILMASALFAFAPTSAAYDMHTISEGSANWSSSAAIAAEGPSSITPSSISDLGLKPPTEDKPQIKLNGRVPTSQQQAMPRKENVRQPILQGLVYFPERAPMDPNVKSPAGPQVKQQLDYYSDILVLTAVSADQPDGPLLAGAKFPVSSVRFPFSFQMYKENLLTSKAGVEEVWNRVADTGDVILRANICPSDASAFPCDQKETKKYAEGVAKLITNLPGLPEGEKIRAPASLALQ